MSWEASVFASAIFQRVPVVLQKERERGKRKDSKERNRKPVKVTTKTRKRITFLVCREIFSEIFAGKWFLWGNREIQLPGSFKILILIDLITDR